MTIKIEHLKRKEALELLNAVRDNVGESYAIQGKQECRYFSTATVTVTLRVEPGDQGKDNFNNNTLEIQSTYWTKSTLLSYLPERYQEATV